MLVGCGANAVVETASPSLQSTPASVAPSGAPVVDEVEPAPGSGSAVYAPNPAAIVVAIDPGHGGCLDWGVPDPSERGAELAEKTLTLEIAQRLRDLLEADGIGVVMIRDADEALAGDDYPPLGCDGAPWRDVNGDGMTGFGNDDLPQATRTRDELQARIDLTNLARADAFVSIHINSLTENGVIFDLAATQSFYDDETPWGAGRSAALAAGLQDGIVAALDPIAHYDRQDRGTEAVAYYVISRRWIEGDTCATPGDTWCKPHRALEMPGVLSEVGSITLREEHDLLASAEGQEAIADGLLDGLAGFFADRPLAARIGLADGDDGPLEPVAGDGPPYWPEVAPEGPVRLRLTNNGTEAWPSRMQLVAGWEETDQPYLAFAPEQLAPLAVEVPPLGPGESVVVDVTLPDAPEARAVAWLSLIGNGETLSDLGSPALQLSNQAP